MPDPEAARLARRARMIPAAAARADVLLAAAREACAVLAKANGKKLVALLPALGTTGSSYDEWTTSVQVRASAKLFADGAALKKALAEEDPRAMALAPALLVDVDPHRAFALVKDALPLDDTHFAPNFLEAYVQKALAHVLDRLLAATPPDQVTAGFLAGRQPLEEMTAEQVARLPHDAVIDALTGDRLGYVHRDDVEGFLEKHPSWNDAASLTTLYARAGRSRSHAAFATTSVVVGRLRALRHAPAADVAAELHELYAEHEAGPGSVVASSAFELLLALGHEPTLTREHAKLAALAKKRRFTFDPHHTIPELRGPIRAGFALAPTTASARFAPWFRPQAVATAHGAKVAYDILLAGQGTMTDHDGTVLRHASSFLHADPGWRVVLAPLAGHARLGRLVKQVLQGLAKRARRT